jgi:hypothetical protein
LHHITTINHKEITMFNVQLTMKSKNEKTGPIPVSTTGAQSCPNSCSLKGSGCYAEAGPLGMHWRKVTGGERGTDWGTFCKTVAGFPEGQFWRHNQAGDLPGNGDTIDADMLMQLINANKGRKGFTYTHYDPALGLNSALIKLANEEGFTVNLSAESLHEADKLAALNIAPVATMLEEGAAKVTHTPQGRKVITCPATYRDDVSCATCQLCQHGDSRAIIGFPVHGASKRKAGKVFVIKSV